MHVVIRKNQVNSYKDKMSEGSAIIIRNFKVSESTGHYWPVSTHLKITFLRITVVQKLQEDSVQISENGFQFIEIHDKSFALLNSCQRPAYDAIISSLDKEEAQLFLYTTMVVRARDFCGRQ